MFASLDSFPLLLFPFSPFMNEKDMKETRDVNAYVGKPEWLMFSGSKLNDERIPKEWTTPPKWKQRPKTNARQIDNKIHDQIAENCGLAIRGSRLVLFVCCPACAVELITFGRGFERHFDVRNTPPRGATLSRPLQRTLHEPPLRTKR
jgi:hypothetical protein